MILTPGQTQSKCPEVRSNTSICFVHFHTRERCMLDYKWFIFTDSEWSHEVWIWQWLQRGTQWCPWQWYVLYVLWTVLHNVFRCKLWVNGTKWTRFLLAGVQTGHCVQYSDTIKTCEVQAWCPLENDNIIPKWVSLVKVGKFDSI